MNILLVEDSATLRHAMSSYIRGAGHVPIVAQSGEEALQIAEHAPIDMIIMDVEMPGLDGFETTRLIREGLGDYWLPIIFVTGKNDEADLHEGIDAGGDDYLTKPVSKVILQAKIRAMERITSMRDQLAQLNNELTKLSQTDGLTQLLNRRTFESKAEELWRQASRNKEPVAVVLIDVDYFKLYNDYYGHPAGDECLRTIADVFKKRLNRPTDLVGRYGGEEFIALLTNTPEEGALHVAEDIRRGVEELNIKHQGSPLDTKVTLSLGVSATNFTTGTYLSEQVSHADKALYASKQAGRNRVTLEVFNPHSCVLVVTDHKKTLKLVSNHLKGHYSVVDVTTGDECRKTAETTHPNVILVDADVASLDIASLCETLRANRRTTSIPIILFSERTKNDLEELGEKVRADAWLRKPADRHRLIALISQFLPDKKPA